MNFSLMLECDNSAFGGTAYLRAAEVAQILTRATDALMDGHTDGPLYDSNGNQVGLFSFSGKPSRRRRDLEGIRHMPRATP
jgi:hypothetical protein